MSGIAELRATLGRSNAQGRLGGRQGGTRFIAGLWPGQGMASAAVAGSEACKNCHTPAVQGRAWGARGINSGRLSAES